VTCDRIQPIFFTTDVLIFNFLSHFAAQKRTKKTERGLQIHSRVEVKDLPIRAVGHAVDYHRNTVPLLIYRRN